MECTFFNAAGQTLFVRDDMESGHWVQEQMNLTADYPYDETRVIQIGQRVAFRDPATDILQVFEIINVTNHEPDHFQQITAEHICISELADEHINTTKITDKTAAQALTTVLSGTLWSLGANTASGAQSADISRGSVWDAVSAICQSWNVYITPRVVISSAGTISGRYLDIAPAAGVWRGLRLSVRKNLLDPVVTYDDSEVYTALYGYGGSVGKAQQSGDDTTQELTFADQVWTATTDHPAKPSGQTYIEWPEMTALYGRNGRPRFGYYQNSNIKDSAVLLEKTWESLKQSCQPKISISGTCADLYRLGYKDEPIRLHDLAIVEIEETGEIFQKEIVCCDIDLIDPTGTRPEIGDYVPNIVYINRETNKRASGGGGGGRSKGSMTNLEDDDIKTFTEFVKTNDMIGMVVGTKNGTNYIKAGEIALSINAEGSTARIHADRILFKNQNFDSILQNGTLELHALLAEGGIQGANVDGGDGEFDTFHVLTYFETYKAFIGAGGISVGDGKLQFGGTAVSWQSKTVVTGITRSNTRNFVYAVNGDITNLSTILGSLVTDVSKSTIYYLGHT